MIKIGIVGYGKMGKIREKAVVDNGGEIVSIFDPLLDDGCVDDIFKDTNIDAIFICTPNHFNKEYTIEALKNGKNVFCEKPPAFTENDVKEIQEAEMASGCKLMYGFNHRHHESIQHLKNVVDSGEYGDILWLRGRYGKSSNSTFFNEWRSKKDLAGGGIFLDQGVHMLDLFLYLVGDFHDVQAMVSNNYWNLDGIEDNVFATNVTASLHSTMTQWRHLFSLEIFLENGYLVLNGLKTPSGSYGKEILTKANNRSSPPKASWESEEHIEFHTDNSWRLEVEHFFNAIKNDTLVSMGNSSDARKVMRLVDKVYDYKDF